MKLDIIFHHCPSQLVDLTRKKAMGSLAMHLFSEMEDEGKKSSN